MDRLFKESESDVIIDSFLFHTMTEEERPIFARQVYKVLKPVGKYFILCFSDKDSAGPGPRRISKAEIEHTLHRFSKLFAMLRICCKFEVKFLCIMGKIDLPIWNFLPNNFLRFVILQNLCYTVKLSLFQFRF